MSARVRPLSVILAIAAFTSPLFKRTEDNRLMLRQKWRAYLPSHLDWKQTKNFGANLHFLSFVVFMAFPMS